MDYIGRSDSIDVCPVRCMIQSKLYIMDLQNHRGTSGDRGCIRVLEGYLYSRERAWSEPSPQRSEV